MAEKKRWVVEGFLEGNLFIPESDSNLPITSGMAALTRYVILEQNLLQRPSRKIFWVLRFRLMQIMCALHFRRWRHLSGHLPL